MAGAMFTGILHRLRAERRDARGGRCVAVIECILNQNARDRGAAAYPALNAAVVALCARYGVGMLQIPCPEIRALGPARARPAGVGIRDCMDSPAGWRACREIGEDLARRVREYLDQGVELLAVLGGNPESPGCAVHPSACVDGNLDTASGILMQTLSEAFAAADIRVPFRGMRDCREDWLAEDLHWLEQLFNGTMQGKSR